MPMDEDSSDWPEADLNQIAAIGIEDEIRSHDKALAQQQADKVRVHNALYILQVAFTRTIRTAFHHVCTSIKTHQHPFCASVDSHSISFLSIHKPFL